MQLNSVKLENFRCKKEAELQLGQRLTLLMGDNGSGKTTFLDAIAIGLGEVLTYLPKVSGISFKKHGEIHQTNNQQAPYTRITLETTKGIVWDRQQKRDTSKRTQACIPPAKGVKALKKELDQQVIDPWNQGQTFELPVFAYYGVSRALLDLPQTRKGFPKEHQRFEALSNALQADTRFKSAFVWFYNKENEEHRQQKAHKSFDVTLPELNAVRRAVEALFTDLHDPHIELNPLRFAIRQGQETLNIAQLSDGYQTLLGLVIDLSSRMAMGNPHLEDPLTAKALVMVDEVDLHLHPKWQAHILADLLRVFPNTQFIVTTHSPFIVEALNNHLKRAQLSQHQLPSELEKILPLQACDIKAYYLKKNTQKALLDEKLGLLDDQLLHYFNQINSTYDQLRDIEWIQKNQS